MKIPKSQWLACVLLFIALLSLLCGESSARKARFRFLARPRRFYAVPFGSNFNFNCTSNDQSATSELYRRQSGGSTTWNLLSPRPGRIVKSGHVYTVLDFGISDAGQYQCRATNALGTTIRWSDGLANLIPKPNLMPPVTIDPVYSVVLTTGQSYNVTCSSVSSSTLQWFKKMKDGSQMVVPSDQTYSEQDSDLNNLKLVLMVKNAQKSEAGVYVCQMTYNGRTDYRYSTLEVYARFRFLARPRRFYAVPFGSNFNFNCTTNDQSATSELYRSTSAGSKIWNLLTPRPGKIVKSGHVYTILDFGISDAGQYQCRATNALGATIRWSDGLANMIPNPNLMPPVTIDPAHAVVLTTGESYNVTCSSVSSSTLQWFKKMKDGSQTVVPNDQTYSEQDSDLNNIKLVLMFKNAQTSEAGVYVCQMTYNSRTDYKYSTLEVYDRLKFISQPNRFLTVAFGESLTINCTTNEPDANVFLYYRKLPSQAWKELVPNKRKVFKNGQTFTLSKFGISDVGNYQCRGSNRRGNRIQWKQGYGLVLGKPNLTPPVKITPKYAVALTVGQSGNITCTSTGHTTLQWFKELGVGNINPVPTSKTVTKRDGNKLSVILMFRNAKKTDSGTYKCLMTFQGKSNQKYTSVKVMDKGSSPHLKGRKKVLSVNETSRVVMSCSATGEPLPNITWYKGSNLIGCLNDGKPCGPLLQYTLKKKTKTKNNTKLVRSQLRISQTSRVRDQGSYICVASNKHGVARRSYQLTVK